MPRIRERIIINIQDPDEVMSGENIEYLMAKLSQIDSGFSTPPTDAKRSLSAFQHSAFADSIAAKPCAEIVHRCFHLFSALRVGIRKIDRVAMIRELKLR